MNAPRIALRAMTLSLAASLAACATTGDDRLDGGIGIDDSEIADSGSLTFLSPTNGATVSGRVTVRVAPPAGTTRVHFFVDDVWLSTDNDGSPWQAVIDATRLGAGTHTIRAGAFDRRDEFLARRTITVSIGSTADAGTGMGTDAATDARTDAMADAGAVQDARVDAAVDTGSDAGADVRTDAMAPTDTGSPTGPAPVIPTPTGACPEFTDGRLLFQPAGIPARYAQIYMGPEARTMHGPVIFWWHGNNETSPVNGVRYAFGDAGIAAIKAMGGIIIGAYKDPSNPNAWYALSGDRDDDLRYADEVLACAHQRVGIDPRRVHSAGMSAGGIHTSRMSYLRSNYLASVVVMSGGFTRTPPAVQNPDNRFPALIFYGGPNDLPALGIVDAVYRYQRELDARGHFTMLCNHGDGHVIPLDAQTSVRRFLLDHPWGTATSPYATTLPAGFVNYCER